MVNNVFLHCVKYSLKRVGVGRKLALKSHAIRKRVFWGVSMLQCVREVRDFAESLGSPRTHINARESAESLPWLHGFARVFSASVELLKSRGNPRTS